MSAATVIDGYFTTEIDVTSFHPAPHGGGIAVGRARKGDLLTFSLPGDVLHRPPSAGETWRISGQDRLVGRNGDMRVAEVALPLMPTGDAVVRLLATSPSFPGIGWKTARLLRDSLGDDFHPALIRRDARRIADAIGPERAITIIGGFGSLADEVEVLRWLDRYGVSARTAGLIVGIWGRGAIARIEADPYSLALLEPWPSVDRRALAMGVSLDDPRRLVAAVEEVLAERYRLGHVAATEEQLLAGLAKLLGAPDTDRMRNCLWLAERSGRVLIVMPEALVQSRGVWFMEREVERMITARLARPENAVDLRAAEDAIRQVEEDLGHRLADRQRDAVLMAVRSPFSLLCGAAGTGKTTVVRAILSAREALAGAGGADLPQIALAGRAAKRIAEATGRPAMTIARFLRQLDVGKDVPRRGLLVIDEASMVDLPTLYRVLAVLPDGMDVLLVGDPAQLPPIGPGRPYHRLIDDPSVPKVELEVVHRQEAATGIPMVAACVRRGVMPALPRFDPARPDAPGVFFHSIGEATIADAVATVFGSLASPPPEPGNADALHARDVQILCATSRGPGGSRAINAVIEERWMAPQPPIPGWGLSVGSKVVWTRNDYEKAPLLGEDGRPQVDPVTGRALCAGFMNGSLGVIRRRTASGAWVAFDDGVEDEIRESDLEKVARGWAISVHKAQGSAFRRVIVPITPSRMLTRAMVYTAVTRAVETCVLVGDASALRPGALATTAPTV